MNKQQTFETALNRLEAITKELEDTEVPLDDMVSKYEEAVKLAKFCLEKLTRAEQKIKLLTGDDASSLTLEDANQDLPDL